uniref:Venom polypeptide n=1 Tax=Dolopus genitalis TaxID=2488630 RepID=A0A3G5BIH9_DOLGE|nr:venom polypeptide [Dolopus genitalis]
MIGLLSIALLLVSVFNASGVRMEPRIVGGVDTMIEKVPWQAELLYFTVHRCGASIVNETTIITAAHCLERVRRAKSLTVRAGTSFRAKGKDNHDGVTITVKKFLRHPKYEDSGFDYDVAMLWLESPLEFSEKIQPVELPSRNEPIPKGSVGIASGWGKLFENGIIPEVLHSVAVPIWDQNECVTLYKQRKEEITENMLCAGEKSGGKDACQQDSGGPLVVGKKLVGVISWSIGCGRPNLPGVYARVAAVRGWIDEVMNM